VQRELRVLVVDEGKRMELWKVKFIREGIMMFK
jgi:hypothetical protein